MLRIATIQGITGSVNHETELLERARNWFENVQPAGMETVGWYRTIGVPTSAVYIFKSQSARDIEKLLNYWREWHFDIHLGQDWLDRLSLSHGSPATSNNTKFLYLAFLHGIRSWALDEPAFVHQLRSWLDVSHHSPVSTVGLYKVLGSQASLIYIFHMDNHHQLEELSGYWKGLSYELAPAVDWAATWRKKGIPVV